jgi:hypothetical protein
LWTDSQGKPHNATGAAIGMDYGRTFISALGIQVKTLPIKYLPEDPSQFILYLDPEQSEEAHAQKLLLAEVAGGVGLLCIPLFFLRRRAERQRNQAKPGQKLLTPEAMVTTSWLFMSLLFYAIAVGIHFDPKGHATDIKAFGAEPFGFPVTAVVIAVGTILYLPVIWMLRHMARIAVQAFMDGKRPSLIYLLTGGGHPHLRGSVGAMWAGGVYLVALMGAWIVYTAIKGI